MTPSSPYETDVLRTLSLQFNLQDEPGGPFPTPGQLRRLLELAVRLGDEVDALKRSIFYGSDYPAPAASVSTEPTSFHVGDSDPDLPFPSPDMVHSALGIFTEAAEFLAAVCASTFDGQSFDKINAIEELGDLEWYMAVMRTRLEVSQAEVQRRNIAKLRARYPQRFASNDALNRDLEAERDALQG